MMVMMGSSRDDGEDCKFTTSVAFDLKQRKTNRHEVALKSARRTSQLRATNALQPLSRLPWKMQPSALSI